MARFNPAQIRNKKAASKGFMQAEDLFYDKMVQVFSRKTGEYLGYVYIGQDPETLQEQIDAEPLPETEIPNINQLNLFQP